MGFISPVREIQEKQDLLLLSRYTFSKRLVLVFISVTLTQWKYGKNNISCILMITPSKYQAAL